MTKLIGAFYGYVKAPKNGSFGYRFSCSLPLNNYLQQLRPLTNSMPFFPVSKTLRSFVQIRRIIDFRTKPETELMLTEITFQCKLISS
jgi:hypothetical protein